MNPPQKTNSSQTLVTLLLLLVLVALISGYIYYGMYQARQTEIVVEPVAEMPMTDDERRNAIVNQLAEDAPVMNAEEQARVIAELEQSDSPDEVSEERRTEIINAMGQ